MCRFLCTQPGQQFLLDSRFERFHEMPHIISRHPLQHPDTVSLLHLIKQLQLLISVEPVEYHGKCLGGQNADHFRPGCSSKTSDDIELVIFMKFEETAAEFFFFLCGEQIPESIKRCLTHFLFRINHGTPPPQLKYHYRTHTLLSHIHYTTKKSGQDFYC